MNFDLRNGGEKEDCKIINRKYLREFDPHTGKQLKLADPTRRIEP